MAAKSEDPAKVLEELRRVDGVEGSALVSRDGITVVADLPPSYDRDTFSAMTAAMLGAAETAMVEIGRGMPDRVVVETKNSRILAMGLTAELMLVVLSNGRSTIPQIAQGVESLGERIRRLVG